MMPTPVQVLIYKLARHDDRTRLDNCKLMVANAYPLQLLLSSNSPFTSLR